MKREVSKVRIYKIVIICITTIMHVHIYAETNFNEIVVTPLKKPTKLFDSLNSVEIITSKEIAQKGYSTVNEILEKSSSISIGSNGGLGQTKSIFMRGTESNHTKVLINGVTLNPNTLGVPSIQHISVEMIDRIEISKGGMSPLYGKDSIGGVINIITKKNQNNKIGISIGTYNTQKIDYTGGLGYKNHLVNINISSIISNSYKAKVNSSKNHEYDNRNFDLNYNLGLDEREFSVNYYQSIGNTQYDSFGTNLHQDHKDNHLKLNVNESFESSYLDMFYIKKGNKINQASSGATDYTHTDVSTYGLEYVIENSDSDHVLIGLDYTDESMSELSYGTSFKHNNTIKQIYLNAKKEVTSKLVASIGLRSLNHSTYNEFNTGKIGFGYYVNPDLIISSTFGTAFRAPDATDLFGYGGNENLNPEKSINSEILLKYEPSKNESMIFAIFNNQIKDLIESNGSNMQNINKAEINGMDINYTRYLPNSVIDIKFTHQDPRDKTNNVILSRRPKNKLITSYTQFLEKSDSLNITISAESNKDNSIYDSHRLGGYVSVDMNYTKTMGDFLLGVRINNILDKHMRKAHNYNSDGRAISLSINRQF